MEGIESAREDNVDFTGTYSWLNALVMETMLGKTAYKHGDSWHGLPSYGNMETTAKTIFL